MSLHFSANQFEREFQAKRLGNWQVPKWFPEHPRQRLSKTRVIADDRGHLMPGVPRDQQPWGKYVTAWDFPRKITRSLAQEIAAPRRGAAWTGRKQDPPATPAEPHPGYAAAVTDEGPAAAGGPESRPTSTEGLLEARREEERPSPPPSSREGSQPQCENCGRKNKSPRKCQYQLEQEKLNQYTKMPC